MKKLLLFLLLITSFAYGQQTNSTNTSFSNGLGATKFFNIPSGAAFPTTGILTGSLFYKTSSTVGYYYYDGSTWQLIGTTAGSVTSFNGRTGAVTLLSADVVSALGYTPVTDARTITINGTAQDLSANRTWSVGTVTSVAALTLGTTGTDLTSSVATGTTTPVITLNVPTASASNRGALSAADWTTFNSKQAAGNYITALTGDVTASGAGSVTATLATVNSNVGSFGSSTSIPSFTVDGKGRITAASGNVVIAPAGTLTGTTLASNVVTSSLTTVGTIGSGTWNGTVVAGQYGGTGVANTGKTITLGGSLTTSGAFGSTFTMTGTTAVTFPTSGTLATTTNLGDYLPLVAGNSNPLSGNLVIVKAAPFFIADGSSTNEGAGFQALGWNTTNKNWEVSTGITGGALNFIPSTIVGGNVFTTPVATLTSAGVFTTTTFVGALTGNASSADTWSNSRSISVTGDLSWTVSINGSSNQSSAGVLATVNSNVGTFGSATQVAQVTLNGKGLTTAGANVTITPAVGSITGLGTGVATALAVNVGSAGAFVTFNGAGGTPSSMVGTNITGTASGLSIGGNAATATTATNTTNTAITDDNSTNATMYPTWVTATTGNLPIKVSSTGVTWNPSTKALALAGTLTTYGGWTMLGNGPNLYLGIATTGTSGNIPTFYQYSANGTYSWARLTSDVSGTLSWVDGTGGNQRLTLTQAGLLGVTSLALAGTTLTTTATKLNFLTSAAGTTGTTSTNIVFSTSPTLVTPVLGAATATSLALSGALSGATTIGLSGLLTSTVGNNAQVLSSASATTGYQFASMSSSGASFNFGFEAATAAGLFTGAQNNAGFVYTNTATPLQFATNSVLALTIDSSQRLIASSTIRLKNYTVATLPASPSQGDICIVTDALAPSFLVTIVGGGSVVTQVLYNGSSWVAQ